MGAFHMSQVVFDVPPLEVRQRLVRWLGAKGFVAQEGAPLVALDREHERGLILKSRGSTTIVLYNDLMEQERLLFELKRLGGAVLDAWLHDSDVWGYQLHEGGQCVSAFNSNPRYFGGAERPQGPDDLGALARVADRPEDALRKARKTRALFAEGLNEQFLGALGVRGAATKYDYHREDAFRPALDEGFEVEHLWFRREGHDPLAALDLARLDFAARPEDPGAAMRAQYSEEDLARIEAMQARAVRRARLFSVLFWPIGLFFRLLMGATTFLARRRLLRQLREAAPVEQAPAPQSPVVELEDGRLFHPRLGLELRLPPGAERRPVDLVDLGPSLPFSCHLGELRLGIRACPVAEVMNMARWLPPGVEVIQELDFAGELPLKIVRQRYPGPPTSWSCVVLVKGPQAVFLGETGGQGAPDPAAEEALVGLMASLRFRGPAGPAS